MLLAPVRALSCDPPGLGTAEAAWICGCDDSHDYLVKDGSDGSCTPHNEWFCTKLAECVAIASPPCAIVELPDGTLAFGSRWEGGVAKDHWPDMIKAGVISYDSLHPTLSRIYAFDQFVGNLDRHLKNYIIRSKRNGYGVLAFDYSEAWMVYGFPPSSLPLPYNSKTIERYRWLCRELGDYIVQDHVDECLNRLLGITESQVEFILSSQPEIWLTSAEKAAILSWWASANRELRIEGIRRGIRDGSYR